MGGKSGRVEGKVAIVTGAASGIGAATARRLTEEGASVLLTDLAQDAGEATTAQLKDTGANARFAVHDVALEADWARIAEEAKRHFGRIDVLVNNAGVGGYTPVLSGSFERWRKVLGVNLDAIFLGMRHVCPIMAEGGGGSVINVSSILGKVGQAGFAAYCASKGGVLMLTKSAALELAPLSIRVNSVHPGFIDTLMTNGALDRSANGDQLREALVADQPLGRLGQAVEIANGILFLASDEASFMTGGELVIDGGFIAK